MVARGDGSRATLDERAVHRPELLEDPVPLAVEARRRSGREDGVAFELDDGEIGFTPAMIVSRRAPSTG